MYILQCSCVIGACLVTVNMTIIGYSNSLNCWFYAIFTSYSWLPISIDHLTATFRYDRDICIVQVVKNSPFKFTMCPAKSFRHVCLEKRESLGL